MTPILPLKEWLSNSRPDAMPIAWQGDNTWTLAHLRRDVAKLIEQIHSHDGTRWALCCENSYLFLVALLATLCAGRTPVLPGHCRPSQLKEQSALFDGIVSDKRLDWQEALIVVGSANIAEPFTATLPAISNDSVIELFTSGSTAQPRRVIKSLLVLEKEANLLAARFAKKLEGCRVIASVMPQHLYGLTFSILLPMSLGLPFQANQIHFPEQLSTRRHQHRYFFVSSPAFLKRLDFNLTPPAAAMVLSAGGEFPWKEASDAQTWFGLTLDEIYGSTETGILAWRDREQDETPWTLFPNVQITPENGVFRAFSPLIDDKNGLLLDDILRFEDDGRFHLCGRRGRVVKIEEKRIALHEIEQRLIALEGIQDAAAVQITRAGRQCIGVFVVLDDDSGQMWRNGNKKAMEIAWRRRLMLWLEPVAIPRYWQVINEIPVNSMNKRVYAQLQELFNATP